MGDAREIKIPRDALIGMMTGLGILYRAGASENEWFPKIQQAVANLEAAGFRILGPDEVDPLTLEKALVAVNEIAQRGFSAAYRAGASDCDASLRALGRKA